MASCSSSTVMTTCVDKAFNYDAFLSFSGEDTRYSFTDHLYHALTQAGIGTFRDNEEINKGEELKPEFKEAIQESRGSIVVLSKNYATSTWCLDELLLILEQKSKGNHFVLPVFYGVQPTDIRNQKGSFAIKAQSSTKWTEQKVSQWKTALLEVADLAGFVVSGPETIILKDIVDTTLSKLDHKDLYLPPNITGMATHDKEINSWLEQCNYNFLVIYGMGGSGKTTLAKYIYSNQASFVYLSFLEDIGSKCETANGLLELQEQLLKDISGGKNRKIPSLSRGTPLIGEALKANKALIVLDDIVGRDQLVALLGTGKINAQSKIIITTRENTDNWYDSTYWRCLKYEMKLLNGDESSKLLCLHAFGCKTPMVGFKELVLRTIKYCEGNPLALEVLGSSLTENSIKYWESHLNLLEKEMHFGIQCVLQRSYLSLPYNSEKELFLHIACFFIGKDMDYVAKILEPDYSAISGIKTLVNRCLLSVSPSRKLTMHKLLQEMGKNIVRQETDIPAERSRVWLSSDSYKILKKRMGSTTVQGLALDMKALSEEDIAFKSSNLKTDALENMDRLKLLQLNFVELSGSYENISEDLRWLCWLGFRLTTIPPNLYMGNLVAIDLSYSNLEVFKPPTVLRSLRILNLKDSHNLTAIRNISKLPHLETLILWNCYSLVHVCNSIGDLTSLALLNMTGCNNTLGYLTKPTFPFPFSLRRLFLKDCHLECTDSFPLSFGVQLDLQYLNLGNSLFEALPCYNHLKNLRVLDLSFCSRLKCLICLPSTLAELYIYGCELLERITFQSPRFTLQEFGYLGCINLYEVEGFVKLVPIAKLVATDLGHMKWLQQYQHYQMCLVGDDELTEGRSWHIQMLYEFDILSTSLPDIMDPNMTPKYISKTPSLSFDVPSCPKSKKLKGINIAFKYALSGDDLVWFCKVGTANGVVDLMYSPKVFGKPEVGEVCIWLSYWPIGYTLKTGDTVNVSIVVLSGLEVHECGVSLVYSDNENLENNTECAEILGGDLSGFQLSTGAYYLCRRDFFELVEVGRLTPDWFSILVGDTIDNTEVRGWRKTGLPKHVIPSFTELKTIRCIIHGPQLEDIYNITEMSKLSTGDKTMAFTSSLLEGEMKSGTSTELIDETMEMESICENTVVSDEKYNNFIPTLRSGEWSDIGHRSYMEDTHICIPDLARTFNNKFLGQEIVSFYGVFDGHGGKGASKFVCDNLPRIIVDDANFPMELEKAVTRSFVETDAAFARSCALESALSSGTTALTAMIFGRSLLVANAGDCRAVLSRHGLAFEMSKDHRPCYDKERLRIESSGGFIEDGYLNGQLAVTRAIGNWHIQGLKEMDDQAGPLSAEPELKLVTLTNEDEFLIIGSDGIWDVFRNQNAVDFVRRRLQEHNDVKRCCKEMVEEAMKRGALDNLTVVIVCFQAEPPPPVVVQRGRVRRSISAEGLLNLKFHLEG